MKSKNKNLRFKSVVGSWRAFAAILILFGTGSVVVAATADFPLPYDEQYHFTLIQYYSSQVSPFITTQPAELSVTGDATRYGSYLSHYLLSFPLRFFALFIDNTQLQVLLLRAINIIFVIVGLILLRKFVIGLIDSKVAANISVVLLAALPVTTQLAATINYDNLILLLFAALLVMMQGAAKQVAGTGHISATLLFGFVTIALAGCLVKYTFLPLAVVLLAFMALMMIRHKAWPSFSDKVLGRSKLVTGAAILACLATTGLFAERYVGNLVAYKSFQPDCAAVQPIDVCMQYGPWARNYGFEQAAATNTLFEGRSVQGFLVNDWAPLMARGLGGVSSQGVVAEIPKPFENVILAVMASLVIGALGAAVLYRKNIIVLMTVLATGLYVVALFHVNYTQFMSLHEIVAVQGRYILPLLVPMVIIGLMGLHMYVLQARLATSTGLRLIRLLRTIHPDEAYDRSVRYWSAKVWQRGARDI